MTEQPSHRRGFIKGIVAGIAGAFFALRGAAPVEAAAISTLTVLRARTRYPNPVSEDNEERIRQWRTFYRSLAAEPTLRRGQMVAMLVTKEDYPITSGTDEVSFHDIDFIYYVFASPSGKRTVAIGGHMTQPIDDPNLTAFGVILDM
jgi:hypothetical protein